MNREIRFRGKRLDNNQWVYGFYVQNEIFKKRINHFIYDNGILSEVDPSTVGQLTGLRDRKGVEIYDNDLLLHKGFYWKVYYCQERSGFYCKRFEHRAKPPKKVYKTLKSMIGKGAVVAGNFYQNPELLK